MKHTEAEAASNWGLCVKMDDSGNFVSDQQFDFGYSDSEAESDVGPDDILRYCARTCVQ